MMMMIIIIIIIIITIIKHRWNENNHAWIQHINLYKLSEVTASIIKYTSILIVNCLQELINNLLNLQTRYPTATIIIIQIIIIIMINALVLPPIHTVDTPQLLDSRKTAIEIFQYQILISTWCSFTFALRCWQWLKVTYDCFKQKAFTSLTCFIKLVMIILHLLCADARYIPSAEVISFHAFFSFR